MWVNVGGLNGVVHNIPYSDGSPQCPEEHKCLTLDTGHRKFVMVMWVVKGAA
jgi:hypothetical protein